MEIINSLPDDDKPSFFGLPANIERSSQRIISSQVSFYTQLAIAYFALWSTYPQIPQVVDTFSLKDYISCVHTTVQS